jgi:hypothetical protein
MQLQLHDPSYTEELADFLASLGQAPVVAGPARVDLGNGDEAARVELEIYLRVWRVLHPDVTVELAA